MPPRPPKLPVNCDIQIAESGFMYLGIYNTPQESLFLEENLMKPLARFRRDVKL